MWCQGVHLLSRTAVCANESRYSRSDRIRMSVALSSITAAVFITWMMSW
jgi:hypothetical protein